MHEPTCTGRDAIKETRVIVLQRGCGQGRLRSSRRSATRQPRKIARRRIGVVGMAYHHPDRVMIGTNKYGVLAFRILYWRESFSLCRGWLGGSTCFAWGSCNSYWFVLCILCSLTLSFPGLRVALLIVYPWGKVKISRWDSRCTGIDRLPRLPRCLPSLYMSMPCAALGVED